MAIRFIYFDLGRVLLDFDYEVMLAQVCETAGLEHGVAEQAIFQEGLQWRFETGQISVDSFHSEFCRTTGTCCPPEPLIVAASDIFDVRTEILPVVAQLSQAGYPLGILSNTAEHHWSHCLRRYAFLREFFGVYTLSFRVGAMKPDVRIFRAAAERAGYPPEEIFFCDDVAENVRGARAAGIDAVQYVTTRQLVTDLRLRGIEMNY